MRWLTALFLAAVVALPSPGAVAAGGKPGIELSKREAGAGGSITVTGEGWQPRQILMLLICGQNMAGGTNSCANADGRAVTTNAEGGFTRNLPVAEPPRPCPCVVHASTVTGERAEAQAKFVVAGHNVEPLPEESDNARISVLTRPSLEGSDSVLTWFGAPPARRLVVILGNEGSSAVKNPVFEVGTSHGVFAPQWEERRWRGTIAPGGKARVTLDVQLGAGAHGDHLVTLKYGQQMLAEQPWSVERPWGVTLFWVLLCLVVPAAVFRAGMAAVNRAAVGVRRRPAHVRPRHPLRLPPPRPTPPWFAPDTDTETR
jgi:hypothetical protein